MLYRIIKYIFVLSLSVGRKAKVWGRVSKAERTSSMFHKEVKTPD